MFDQLICNKFTSALDVKNVGLEFGLQYWVMDENKKKISFDMTSLESGGLSGLPLQKYR